jgi:hypothetical protein
MYRSRFAFALAIAALAAILVPSSLPAQITFERTYGGARRDEGRSVQQTTDGGYIIAGSKDIYPGNDCNVYLIKTGSCGDTLWTRTFGGTGYEDGTCVQQTSDGGYIVVGTTDSHGAGFYDVWLIKTDSNGDTAWTRTYGGAGYDGGWSVQQTVDSGYIIAGFTRSYGAGWADYYLIKTDVHGDTLWTRTFGAADNDCAYAVQQTTDTGYILGGISDGVGIWLVKTDAHGDTMWTRALGGSSFGDVRRTNDGGYVIVGCYYSVDLGRARLIKIDANGDTLWSRQYGGTTGAWGYSVEQTAGGGFIVAAAVPSQGGGPSDVYLIKTDSVGDTLWTRTIGGQWDEVGYCVRLTADGGYVVTGQKYWSYTPESGDAYLIKTNADGNVAVAEPKGSPTHAPALSLSCEPNPTTGTTTIRFAPLASRFSPLSLRIYDAQGRAVRSFSSLLSPPSSLVWDGCDDMGQMLPSGAYFIRCDVAGQHATTRIVLQR